MKLALGTVQFGLPYGLSGRSSGVPYDEAELMVRTAKSAGIELVDTAMSYGSSESCLGKIGMDEMKVVTKISSLPDTPGDMANLMGKQVLGSLERLGLDSLYGLLLHHPSQLFSPEGKRITEGLEGLKKDKLVQKTGVSIYSAEELEKLLDCQAFDVVQLPINILDKRLLSTGLIDRLVATGTEIHARSVFLQGLLLKPFDQIPAYFAPWMQLLRAWHDWLGREGRTALEVCIAYIKSLEVIDYLVVGANSNSQLSEIIAAYDSATTCEFPPIESDDPNLLNPGLWQ